MSAEDCLKRGCRHIKNESHPEKLQIWKVCNDCGRRCAILAFEKEQWDALVAEGRILVK